MEHELWRIISRELTTLDRAYRDQPYHHSVGRILRVYLWAVLHDRPTYWACDRRNWRGSCPPRELPDQSTMSRRLRQHDTKHMLEQLMARLDTPSTSSLVRMIDGKPLPVSKHSSDIESKFGRGAGGKDRGYKLHAIYGPTNRPVSWSVTPLNVNEHYEAKELIDDRITPGYLLGDANYDANHLFEHAGQHQVLLLARRRYRKARGVGHHKHSAYRLDAVARVSEPNDFIKQLMSQRRNVETRFANLTSFGGGLTCLPPWVRGLERVTLWVASKIIIRLARDQYQAKACA